MVQIAGKYEYVSSEGLEEYMKAVGGGPQADVAKAFGYGKPTFEVSISGDQLSVTVIIDGNSAVTTCTLGKPFDETLPIGGVLKSLTTREGDKFTTVTDLPDGTQAIRIFEFTNPGMTAYLTDKKSGAKAKRTFRRV